MVGVVKSEAYFSLTADDAQYGIEADRRLKILREFVRNTYTYHQTEILATIINEYTDWEKPVQHPVNIRYLSRLSFTSFFFFFSSKIVSKIISLIIISITDSWVFKIIFLRTLFGSRKVIKKFFYSKQWTKLIIGQPVFTLPLTPTSAFYATSNQFLEILSILTSKNTSDSHRLGIAYPLRSSVNTE